MKLRDVKGKIRETFDRRRGEWDNPAEAFEHAIGMAEERPNERFAVMKKQDTYTALNVRAPGFNQNAERGWAVVGYIDHGGKTIRTDTPHKEFSRQRFDEASNTVAKYLATDGNGRYFVLTYPQTPGSNPQALRKHLDQKAKELGFENYKVVANWTGDIDDAIAHAEEIAANHADRKDEFPAQYHGESEKAKKLKRAKAIISKHKIEEARDPHEVIRNFLDQKKQRDQRGGKLYAERELKKLAQEYQGTMAGMGHRDENDILDDMQALAKKYGLDVEDYLDESTNEGVIDNIRTRHRMKNKMKDFEADRKKYDANGLRVPSADRAERRLRKKLGKKVPSRLNPDQTHNESSGGSLNDIVWAKNVIKPGSTRSMPREYKSGEKVKYGGLTVTVVDHNYERGYVILSRPQWSKDRKVPDTAIEPVNESSNKKMKDDPCWDGYEMVGHKKKNGRSHCRQCRKSI